jgi:hypothetical protein
MEVEGKDGHYPPRWLSVRECAVCGDIYRENQNINGWCPSCELAARMSELADRVMANERELQKVRK